jgi:hypothetical protein
MAKVLQRLTMAAVLIGGLTALAAETADAARPDRPGRRAARPIARRSFSLFAGNPTGELQVNRVYCGMTDAGESCTDVTGSPVLGGGSWPRGTPDVYVFNTGIQVVGIIPSGAGFAWAGDTVGAWAIDTRGPATHMVALSGFYSSLIPDDAANWPSAAYVNDPTLYNPALLGRPTISQQDTWSRYWDGSTTLLTGRRQTAGILVEQRSLAWNFPTGNEDLVYFLYRFTNVTARASSGVYANLSQYGYSATDIAEIAALGDAYQDAAEAAFNIQIPDGGYTIGSTYVAFTADMDVGDAGNNYASASLPFALATTWKSDWLEPAWQFPSNIFSAPFAATPGFVGVKYLKSPIDPNTGSEFGTTIFSTYTNPSAANSPFPDPLNIYQGYRYYQGTAGPATGDQSCQYTPDRHLCFLTQAPSDQRQMQSSGPFDLAPGQSEVVVVAYIFAPAMATNGTFSIGPYIGNTSLLPGIVPSGTRLFSGADTLRAIDRAMGWISHSDNNGDFEITQDEVIVARGSLLDKAMVAQAVFDNQFLLPFAPDAPNFYLIPGSNTVTVVWEKSATETTGDPYFVVASDPTSALYDPNFQQNDVEGYRIWRGRSEAELELIIQYDYAGTAIYDFTGAFYNADYNDPSTGENLCAPEIGVTASCPSDLATGHAIELSTLNAPAYPGAVQVPLGGRVQLANGSILITQADTAVTGRGSGFPALTDTDVPFAYTDNDVRNGYRYFYSVTAFDVNSLASGPTSLSSAMITQSVTPRSVAGNQVPAGAFVVALLDKDGNEIDISTPLPTIDPVTGTFSGPAPPTNYLTTFGRVFSDQLVVPNQTLEVQIDSIIPEWYHLATYHLTVTNASGTTQVSVGPSGPLGEEDGTVDYPFLMPLAADSALAVQQGLAGIPSAGQAEIHLIQPWVTYESKDADWHQDVSNSFFAALSPSVSIHGGSRWFDGANETTPDPTFDLRHGALTGVTAIYRPVRNRNANALVRRIDQTTYHVFRAADFKVYWGAAGHVDSVIDVTHNVVVPFSPQYRASWGLLADFSGNSLGTPSTPDGIYSYHDFLNGPCLTGASGVSIPSCATNSLVQTATLLSVDTTLSGVPQGQGFGMYINGEPFIFVTATLPSSTVWTLRTYGGVVRRSTAGVYSFTTKPRQPNVTGLRARVASTTPAIYPDSVVGDLSAVHTVPDPYYVTNNAEVTTNTKVLQFVNLPDQAIIRIYSVSGILVNIVSHNDPSGGGTATWNLRNRNNQFVASGVYFYHVETPSGATRVARFTVVNYAQ